MRPASGSSGWAFSGPAILVSVGYMDPGNWGTDLQAGAQFKFGLLWVVGMASLMAIFMQVIAARLGVVTGKDLAQCCRDWYPRWTRWPNWLLCEVAIGACDLAEVLGSAVALNLMFHIPLLWAVIITGLDVLLLLGLQRFGMRTIEAVVLLLVATISVCYFIEIFVLPQTQPSFAEMGLALVSPSFRMQTTGTCSYWPSASSGPRSCRTTFTCTRPWCRPAGWERTNGRFAAASASTRSTRRWP